MEIESFYEIKLNQVIDNIESELYQWESSIEKDEKGNYLFTKDNMLIAGGLSALFKTILLNSGYNLVIEIYGKDLNKSILNHVDKREILKFGKNELDKVKALKKINMSQLLNIGNRTGSLIQAEVINSIITGNNIAGLRETIRDILEDKLVNYAETYIRTTRRVMLQKLEELGSAHIKDKKWEYVGPNDEKTRPICVEALKKKIFTEEEMKNYENENGIRWNCRHLFYVIEPQKA